MFIRTHYLFGNISIVRNKIRMDDGAPNEASDTPYLDRFLSVRELIINRYLFQMDKEVLECVLKKCWKDSSVRAVLSVDSSPAVGKNENFLSTVTRLKIKVVLGNGRVATRSFIDKDAKVTNVFADFFAEQFNPFKMEIMIYNTVIKEMEYLMEEFDDTRSVLWCKLIHQVPYNRILLEDLTVSGFAKLKKGVYWDLDHTLMLVNALGRYHAMAKVLEERGHVSKENQMPWFVLKDSEMLNWWIWNMNASIRGIKKYWKPVWGSVVDKIKLTEELLREKLKEMRESIEDGFKVLNHGDLNVNNIMIKHDWNDRPIEIRFIDFQVPHYNSPCCDLVYMLSMGTDPSVRRNDMDLILTTYHESLLKTMDFFNYSGSKPALEEIKDRMERLSFLFLIMSISSVPAHLHTDTDVEVLDTEKMMATEGKEGYNLEMFKNPRVEESIGPDLEKLVTEFF